jgi:hypothetical protein
MAIYALSIKHKAKGQGASAVAHAQYIAREGKYAERKEDRAKAHAEYLTREGKHERRRDELERTWSGNMPAWAKSPGEFWEAADTYERANGRVYSEVVIALPRELSKEVREEVVREFIDKEIGERFTYTVAIHNPRAMDGGEQPHAHVMFSIRERDGIERPKELYFKRANPENPERGGAKKSREWSKDERNNDRVNEIRASWEVIANKALEKEGHEARIDRRTLQEQGIEREPEPKMGPAVTQRLKRGQETEVGEKVLELRNYRKHEQEVKELEGELKREKAKVYNFAEEKERRSSESKDEFRFYGERRNVSEEEKQKYRRTVDLVLTRYEREDGNTEYRWKKSGKVAFVDRGDKITFNSTSPTAVKAGLQVAKEKGWEKVYATGSEEFRREAWTQGQLMGMEVKGYDATKADFERIEVLKKEKELKKEQYKDKQATRDAPGDKENTQEMPSKDEKRGSQQMREKADSGDNWVKASEFVKEIDKEIKEVREKGGKDSKKELDELYRQKYDLKQLGAERVQIEKSPDGKTKLKAPEKVRARARELERSQKKDKGLDRGR